MKTVAEFKSRSVALFKSNVKGRTKVEWVFTFRGRAKGRSKRPVRTGYFIATKNGVSSLWFADWMEGYPLEVKESSNVHWWLLSKQDQSVIKGAWGNIPSPAEYGVEVVVNGKKVA